MTTTHDPGANEVHDDIASMLARNWERLERLGYGPERPALRLVGPDERAPENDGLTARQGIERSLAMIRAHLAQAAASAEGSPRPRLMLVRD